MFQNKKKIGVTCLALVFFMTGTSIFANDVQQRSQKISIQKIVTKSGEKIFGNTELKFREGINGASFKIFDITDLMQEELETLKNDALKKAKVEAYDKAKIEDEKKSIDSSEKNEVNDLKMLVDKTLSLEDIKTVSSDEFVTKLTNTAKKQNLNQLKLFAQGNTKNANNKDGIFEFSVPLSNQDGEYHAYLIVNDKVDDNAATLSEPFVLITPQSDEEGVPLDVVNIYPKGQKIEKPKQEVETKELKTMIEKLPETGIKPDVFSQIIRLFYK